MRKRSLQSILEVRRASVNDARAHLANALSAAEVVAIAISEIATVIQTEIDAACALDADDAAVEAVGRWLPQALLQQQSARIRREAAELMIARARATLAIAQTAEELVQKMLSDIEIRARNYNNRHTSYHFYEQIVLSSIKRS